ncbi:class I SAM-dependent methyltransferase [Bacillus alkalicellulosilyticus]|uniref:class I SAM-dependent methyltransferase n=1 Tax=Alkalihalobacterium alkalicellulosilyticum TaxID=1912214 RepID=UPI000996B4AB|nr:class I SAM-dependent methyltransferase [Bacillus alkalicellulosilyticus]
MKVDLKLNTDNFLHTNPALYSAFNGDHDYSMAQFIHNIFIEFKVGKKVLDVGSGLGREVSYLTNKGYDATGLDNSEDMISWARKHYPGLSFVYGHQSDFDLQQQFDAIYCVGSTFLYNYTNDDIISSLQCFRKHLKSGGLIYLDMRNAAFFFTKEGQRWLTEDLVDQTLLDDTVITLKTRFSIDYSNQLLERDYCWDVASSTPIIEHLRHRLLLPRELDFYLSTCGFRILQLFDKPEPHVSKYELQHPLSYSHDLQGRRMQVIAQAI